MFKDVMQGVVFIYPGNHSCVLTDEIYLFMEKFCSCGLRACLAGNNNGIVTRQPVYENSSVSFPFPPLHILTTF
jgi:hypothetical protein